jgi:hypothetical protein
MQEIEISQWLFQQPARWADHLATIVCPVLVCPQKAIVRIKFLTYFLNPLIK